MGIQRWASRWSVGAAVACVGICGCGASGKPTPPKTAIKSAVCVGIGAGHQICGQTALAYCENDANMFDKIDARDRASVATCLSVGYKPTEADRAWAWFQWPNHSDPLPRPSSRRCLDDPGPTNCFVMVTGGRML